MLGWVVGERHGVTWGVAVGFVRGKAYGKTALSCMCICIDIRSCASQRTRSATPLTASLVTSPAPHSAPHQHTLHLSSPHPHPTQHTHPTPHTPFVPSPAPHGLWCRNGELWRGTGDQQRTAEDHLPGFGSHVIPVVRRIVRTGIEYEVTCFVAQLLRQPGTQSLGGEGGGGGEGEGEGEGGGEGSSN